jgi:hypothetical protein
MRSFACSSLVAVARPWVVSHQNNAATAATRKNPATAPTTDRGQRAHLLAPRPARLANEARRIGRDPLGLDGALEDGAEQLEGLADGHRTGPARQALGLPAGNAVGAQLPKRDRAEVGRDVVVIKARVVLARLVRQRHRVGRRPGADDELVERLTA